MLILILTSGFLLTFVIIYALRRGVGFTLSVKVLRRLFEFTMTVPNDRAPHLPE